MSDLGMPHRLAYRLDSEEGALEEIAWPEWCTRLIVERVGSWMRDRPLASSPVHVT
jgi:hypothetical protein